MTHPDHHPFARRLREVIDQPFGTPWSDARVVAAVFFTFTFHRQQFEEHLLPELYGLPIQGERTARLALLQAQFDDGNRPVIFHDAHLPVELDANGTLVHESGLAGPASFRIDTVPVRWGGGHRTCMHAKHVILIVRDDNAGKGDPSHEALLVVTGSGNLTLAGWRKNIELAHVEVLRRNQTTPLAVGLQELFEDAAGWAARVRPGETVGELSGFREIKAWIDALVPADNRLPRLWTGRTSLTDAIEDAVALQDIGPIQRLSAGSPYLSESAGPLAELVARLTPKQLEVLRPMDALGRDMSEPDWERAVAELRQEGMETSTIHSIATALLTKDTGRTTHLKWIYVEGTRGAVLMLGSPNLSDPAFGPHTRPGTNYESAVLLSVRRGLRFLDPEPLAPSSHRTSPQSLLDPNSTHRPAIAPFHLTFDWKMPAGQRARVLLLDDDGTMPSASAEVRGIGVDPSNGRALALDSGSVVGIAAEEVIEQALRLGPFVYVRERADDGVDHMVQVIELHQDHAPIRSRFRMTVAQLLRYVTASGRRDWKRAERDADNEDRLRVEAEESIDGGGAGGHVLPTIALDRPIAIIQATLQLERLAREALASGNDGALARTLFQEGGMSLRNLVDLHLRIEESDLVRQAPDVVDRLVCWLSATSLLDAIEPLLSEDQRPHLDALRGVVAGLESSWAELGEDDRSEPSLKHWLRSNWRMDAPSTAPAHTDAP